MTDHKFEPFEKVLVRDSYYRLWRADFFSHNDGDSEFPFCCVRDDWRQCIPYTPETAHLLGTAQPYEPPKPPVEYEWGQKVAVLLSSGQWNEGIYLEHDRVATRGGIAWFKKCNIRPLPDTAA